MTGDEERIPLGKTELRISRLGLGTWAWGDRFYWGYGRGGYLDSDLEEAFEISVAGGINFFDTAEVYGVGKSETFLGRFVQGHLSLEENQASDFVIGTKFFPYPWRFLGRALPGALDHSLKRLNRPQVDLYQIHWPWPPRSIETWTRELARCKEKGTIRAVGVSNFKLDLMRRAQKTLAAFGTKLASNQVEYNLLERGAEKSGILEACHEDGITLISHSPLASGILTGKYSPENPPPGPRGRRYNSEVLQRIRPLFDLMDDISRAHQGVTYAQISLNWVMAKGAVPIPGAKNGDQARENLGALGWNLSEEEVAALDDQSDRLANET